MGERNGVWISDLCWVFVCKDVDRSRGRLGRWASESRCRTTAERKGQDTQESVTRPARFDHLKYTVRAFNSAEHWCAGVAKMQSVPVKLCMTDLGYGCRSPLTQPAEHAFANLHQSSEASEL